MWHLPLPAGQLVERTVSIEGITTEAMWRDLEAALGLRRYSLGRFKEWAADMPKHLHGGYDLDAAIAWARRHGLTFEAEQRVRVAADTPLLPDDGLTGRTVHVLIWERGEDGTHSYVRASRRGAADLRDQLIREYWDKVSCYNGYPEEPPPAGPDEALAVWEAVNHDQADPRVGIFYIDTVVIGG
ncbi:hypothetical protein [Dactylosporangium sp. NPDC000521]|uniref:hypothetical protein n=1 Tax=Dactylosporangium sp. NPDC000521 TaxID=3363975 RepID=UPI0036B9D07E